MLGLPIWRTASLAWVAKAANNPLSTTVNIRTFYLCIISLFLLVGTGWVSQTHAQNPTPAPTMTVEGRIIQGTVDGSPLPSDLPVDLLLINRAEGTLFQRLRATAAADGSFVFNNVPRLDDSFLYTVITTYFGFEQNSPPLTAAEMTFIEFPVYETTSSVENVAILEGNIFIDFVGLPVGEIGENREYTISELREAELQVVLDLTLLNTGDRVVYALQQGKDQIYRNMSFALELPVGAYNIGQEGEDPSSLRFQIVDDIIPVVYDTLPIVPNRTHNIRLSFFLPYENGAVIDQIFPVNTAGILLWIPENTVEIQSDQFNLLADTEMRDGTSYLVYSQEAPLPPTQNMIFTIAGIPTLDSASQASAAKAEENNISIVPLVVAGFAVILVIIGIIWMRGSKTITE